MHVRCPHCHNAIEVVPDVPLEHLSCPSCGSHLDFFLNETLTHRSEEPRTVGHFALQELVGVGHYGEVWMARDTQLDRTVAVKIPRTKELTPGSVEQFRREASAAAQLRHPHIVSVHEVGIDGDTLYIVSDFIRGVTLANYLSEHRYAPRDAAALCATVAEALHHAHEAKVVHRDLKPSNIMLDGENRPHLMDFGLAKREAAEATVTAAGKILGTPAYMSPEQARGEGHQADRRSDVYSLGVILYELLTGQRPFKGDTQLLLHQVQFEEPRPPRKLDRRAPRDLETICLKAMAKRPERRYATAQEMAADLHRWLRGEPIAAKRVSRVERVWRWARRKPLHAATAVLSVAVIALIALVVLRRDDGPVKRRVRLETDPPGASVVFVPLDSTTGDPMPGPDNPRGKGPIELRLAAGDYLLVVDAPGVGFHEVFRHVPDVAEENSRSMNPHYDWSAKAGTVTLAAVKIDPKWNFANMAPFDGATDFIVGSDALDGRAPVHHRSVPAFEMDAREVTVGEFRSVMKRLPFEYGNPKRAPVADGDPLTDVSWNDAAEYAERVGKRLPDEFEYEFAATNGGRNDFPWGDSFDVDEWKADAGPTSPRSVSALYSGVAEWTASWGAYYPNADNPQPAMARFERVIRGAPSSIMNGQAKPDDWREGPRSRFVFVRHIGRPGVGFRCCRSTKPRTQPQDFVRVLRQ